MNKDWKRLGALFLIVTLVAVSVSACIGGGETETTTPPPTTAAPTAYNDLPADMDPAWKAYFENTDFDGDGVMYPYDRYLGRDDAEVDFATMTGGAFRMMTAEISDWDPIDVTDTASDTIVSKIFSGLVQYVPGTTDPMPDLAVAWEADDEGKIYTFYLRQGVTFHNGEAFTAEDVVFSWDRLANPVYASARINFLTDYVESYVALDDYTLQVTLKTPFAPFITLMTYTCFKVVPKDYVSALEVVGATADEGVQKNWLDAPVGTGPWTLGSYVSGDSCVLAANTAYWAGRPFLNEFRYRFTEEDDTIVQAWKAGQVDITGVPAQYWDDFNENYADKLTTTAELATYWFYMNTTTWPFDSLAMRQAISCGLEKDSVINSIFKGRYMPAHGPLPPGIFGFSQELYDSYPWEYDLDKALQILDDAGIVDTNDDGIREYQGQELKIELSSYVSTAWQEAAKVWIENAADLGIEMTYQQYDFGTILQMADTFNYKLLTLGWIADYPDPENFLILFETKQIPDPNSTGYSNPQVDAWIEELRTNPNIDERRDITYQITEQLVEDCPMWWFFHSRATRAIHDWVHGYESGAMGPHVEKQLGIWIDADRR
ncbi:MAG: ABC transporter substrate-binding protein [Candidatus Methanofastidiosa archaeon]|nr:ABC transporter substrate-binding protein [Candidatus Methanofastidiosa archaeon]